MPDLPHLPAQPLNTFARRLVVASSVAVLAAAVVPAGAATVLVQVADRTGKPLPETVVFLESAAAKAATRPEKNVEIEQVSKRFNQRVTVVTVGSAVTFPNRDKVRHHVYSFSPVKTFELKLYIGTPSQPVGFDPPGIAGLGCNIHDNMAAWVVIVDTPYHGQSKADGRIQFADVPAGNYRLRSWHPNMPTGAPALDQLLTVDAAGAKATLRLDVAGDPA
jgi:plastocyanin